jgi:hypothetical protein
MAIDDAANDVGQMAIRLHANKLASLNERGDYGPTLGTAVGAGERACGVWAGIAEKYVSVASEDAPQYQASNR